MDVFIAIESRRSIRKYLKKEIQQDKINKIIESARIAPSAANRQEWKFIVVKDQSIRDQLVEACMGQKFIAQAPVLIAACSTESEKVMPCGQYAYSVDLSIALSFMILEATELGLGTCWLGAFQEDRVKSILNIPEEIRLSGLTTLGYPDENPDKRPRKSFDEIICNEKWE